MPYETFNEVGCLEDEVVLTQGRPEDIGAENPLRPQVPRE